MRLDKKESMARKILNYSNRTHIKAVSLLWFCTLHCLTFFPSQVAGLDPLMDDGIEFAKRLVKLGKQVTLDVVPHLPHGFLCLVRHPDTKDTIHTVLSRIKHGLTANLLMRRPLLILLLSKYTNQLQCKHARPFFSSSMTSLST